MRAVAGPQACKGTEAADEAGSKGRSQGRGSLRNEGQEHSYLSHVPRLWQSQGSSQATTLSEEHSKILA